MVLVPAKSWTVTEFATAVGIECLAPMRVSTTRGGCASSAQGRFCTFEADVLTVTCLLFPVPDTETAQTTARGSIADALEDNFPNDNRTDDLPAGTEHTGASTATANSVSASSHAPRSVPCLVHTWTHRDEVLADSGDCGTGF